MIQQVPSYAKFLKDLCTQKWTTNVTKKAYVAAQVSSLLSTDHPVKHKDPSCPTILCLIGTIRIKNALLDLGDNMNLLPYSIYKKLG